MQTIPYEHSPPGTLVGVLEETGKQPRCYQIDVGSSFSSVASAPP